MNFLITSLRAIGIIAISSPTQTFATAEEKNVTPTWFCTSSSTEGNCVDIVQPDVAACGGISEALNIAAMATAYGVECYPHQWGSSISLAATLHLMSAIPAAVPRLAKVPALLELDRAPNIFREQLTDLAPAPTMAVPNGPGLGINVDLDMLNHYSLR